MFVSFILFIYLFYFILFISSAFFFINMVHDPIQVYVINELGQK